MAITATSQRNDGVDNVVHGAHFDDAGSPAAFSFTCGFNPQHVKVINLTDRTVWEWFAASAANTLQTIAAGTMTTITSGGVTVSAAGVVSFPVLQNKQYVYRIEG